jgi:hypothetical protein
MIGRESPLIVFACGIDGALLFQLFPQEFELSFICASLVLCKDVKNILWIIRCNNWRFAILFIYRTVCASEIHGLALKSTEIPQIIVLSREYTSGTKHWWWPTLLSKTTPMAIEA